MNALFVAWQDPVARNWYPVGRLDYSNGDYRFVYTRGARESDRFVPFSGMSKFEDEYKSRDLFPLFANRLISAKRPEYGNFLEWLDLPQGGEPLTLLARSGGLRETDSLILFSRPEPDPDGKLVIHFFCQGIRHLGRSVVERVAELKPGDRLFLLPDPQNRHDEYAIALRTDDPVTIIGYCPRFLAQDFRRLLNEPGKDGPLVEVVRVNGDAPIQLRLLCRLTATWPTGFRPCSGSLYRPLATSPERQLAEPV